jgi:AcrR family transcriptional regulator
MNEDLKDAQREKIIDAASLLFGRFGYKKTSLDDIAKETHKTKTAIYYYFKSKEAVFEAVIDREANILGQELISAVLAKTKPEDKINAYITTRLTTLKKVSVFYDAMKSELLDHLTFMDTVREKYVKIEHNLVKSILSEGIELNQFDIENPDLTAQTIVLAMKGLEVPVFGGNNSGKYTACLKDLVNIIINGLKKR